jgi:glycosyltransferase involved in cell wall biosynthesis
MMALTILMTAANRWWTGSADPVIRLGVGLQARGHRVLLAITPGDRFEAKSREAGLAVLPDVSLTTGMSPRVIADVRALRRILAAERVDLIHANHSHDHWLGLLARGARRDRRVPVVRTFHNARAVKDDPVARLAYRRTAMAFAVSREIEIRCRVVGFGASRTRWLPGSVDLARFATGDAAAIRDELKLGDAPAVVMVARLARSRGHEPLLAGFKLLLSRFPDARLLLVGKGEMRQRLEQVVADHGLGERVIFTGYRDADLPSVLAASDCFVLMAAGSDESCRAALEAMAAGRPVVAARVGALPETVAEGLTGTFIKDASPAGIAAAIGAVLGDRGRARAMGAAGRRRAEEVFAPERAIDVVEQAYMKLS